MSSFQSWKETCQANGFSDEVELETAINSLETEIKKIKNKIEGIQEDPEERIKVTPFSSKLM